MNHFAKSQRKGANKEKWKAHCNRDSSKPRFPQLASFALLVPLELGTRSEGMSLPGNRLVQSEIFPATVTPVSFKAASRPIAAPMPPMTMEISDFAIVGAASNRPCLR
jgi:hypothetical protein